jgi:hypothetical protein
MRLLRRSAELGAIALVCVAAAGPLAPAHALGPDDYIGTVGLTAASYCPSGTMEPAGQTLHIEQYQAVFALIGTAYGGNGTQTFNLPDLSATVPLPGMRWCFVVNGQWPPRD